MCGRCEARRVASFALRLPFTGAGRGVWGSGVVFYTVIFSCMAVLLVVAGLTVMSRNRKQRAAEIRHEESAAHANRRQRNAKREQSRKARRKRA